MPIEGYEHKRVGEYCFRPQPVSILDRRWDASEREWQRNVVERIRRGLAAAEARAAFERAAFLLEHWQSP